MAESILSGPHGLSAVGGSAGAMGFARPLGGDEDMAGWMPTILPANGEEPVAFLSGTPHRVLVQPSGTHGPGRSVGGAVMYDAEHGASFWAATEEGYEEWLWVDAPADGVVASYAFEGALPELRDDRAVLVNGDGLAVLDVEAPEAWAADGRAVDVWLDVEGDHLNLVVDVPDDVRGPLLVDPVWTRVDDLPLERMLHTGTRLLDGRVLVTGGISEAGATVLDRVDLFDPRTNTWSEAAPLPAPMRSHMQALLADGRVFVTRGSAAFLYDPDLDTWTTADPARTRVGGPSALVPQHSALLPTGQLMLSGGFGSLGKTVWLYDPDSDTFHPMPNSLQFRQQHTLQLMGDGTVLAAGGGTTSPSSLVSNTAEVYVPDFSTDEPYLNGSWQALPNMSSGHFDHGTALLTTGPDAGKALICSGLDGSTVPGSYLFNPDCELYDPVTQTFALADPVPAARQRSGTGNGGDFMVRTDAGDAAGSVVIAGGYPVTWRSETYEPESGLWTEGCWMNEARLRHTTTPLLDGTVLVVGGQLWPDVPFDGPLRSVERLNLGMADDDCDGIPNEQDICEDNPTNRSYNPIGVWCGDVSGRVYFDDNEDCTDGGEPGAAGVMIRADSGSDTRYALTDFDGVFKLDLPQGQWDVSVVDRAYLEEVPACGGAAKSYSIAAATAPNDLDFGLKPGCDGTLSITSDDSGNPNNDLCNGVPYTTPCPSNEWMYTVWLSNQGSPWVPGPAPARR